MKKDSQLETKREEAEKIHRELSALSIPDIDMDSAQDLSQKTSTQDAAKGLMASTHIISGLCVGGLLGYGIDYLMGTFPLFFIILLLLGMIAGFRNMIRAVS